MQTNKKELYSFDKLNFSNLKILKFLNILLNYKDNKDLFKNKFKLINESVADCHLININLIKKILELKNDLKYTITYNNKTDICVIDTIEYNLFEDEIKNSNWFSDNNAWIKIYFKNSKKEIIYIDHLLNIFEFNEIKGLIKFPYVSILRLDNE